MARKIFCFFARRRALCKTARNEVSRNIRMEIEAKIKLKDASKLRSILKNASAEFISKTLEKNWLFDHPERTLAKKDKLLRLRQDRNVYLTFKGPRQQSEYKIRQELHIQFPDAPSARSLLESIGFRQWFYYEKIRETWRLDGCEIVLDELPGLGLFVEIEAASDKEIETVRKRLKLSRDYINATYVELLQNLSQESRKQWQFQFPDNHRSALSASG
ncbi:MAG: class IV adenylate cyclase [Candidatus Abyssobacteria bacterium SURF_5]|uniref:Class IV adenylate cyclase n=1 Tax=Abyssobacteria bacterium (strain SURF_5) TaxID=2093360 RepID=A0A3A4NNS9_ABYX5|nr:MAG: class IV adenylate cyclase [Candidatus Abyssubacteria bacterium SURF_5]